MGQGSHLILRPGPLARAARPERHPNGPRHIAPASLLFGILLLAGCTNEDPMELDGSVGSDGSMGTSDSGGITRDGAMALDGSTGVEACTILQTRRRRCTDSRGNGFLLDVFSCEEGVPLCDRPSPYNESNDVLQCVDSYTFDRVFYPATCAQVDDYFAGRLECLLPEHCSGSRDDVGDWQCLIPEGCHCPPGGNCPRPGPAPMRDGGTSTMDGGSSPGEPDAGSPAQPDAGTPGPVDAGGPAPIDAGGPAPIDAGGPAPIDAGGPAPIDAGGPAPVDAGGPPPRPDAGGGPPPRPDAGGPAPPGP